MRRNRRRVVPLVAGVLLLIAAVPAFALPAPVEDRLLGDDAIEAALAEFEASGTINGVRVPLEPFHDNAEVCPLPEEPAPEASEASEAPEAPQAPEAPDVVTAEEQALINEGRQLFFSRNAFGQQPSLGPNESIFGEVLSCADCHSGPAFTDNETHVVGPTEHRPLVPRQTQPLMRLAGTAPFTWDGRFPCLQAQAKAAIQAPLEMNAGAEPTRGQLDALAAFIATIDIADAVPGVDFDPELAARGERLFSEVRGRDPFGRSFPGEQFSCASCHLQEQPFTDNDFHIILFPLFAAPDLEPIDPSHIENGRVAGFQTPGLRGLRFTAPYFHDGLAGDPSGEMTPVSTPPDVALTQVVGFYSERFEFDFTLAETKAVVEFLKSQ